MMPAVTLADGDVGRRSAGAAEADADDAAADARPSPAAVTAQISWSASAEIGRAPSADTEELRTVASTDAVAASGSSAHRLVSP